MERNLFVELMQGVEDMSEHRKGNITLCQYEMSKTSVLQADQDEAGHGEELGSIKIQPQCPDCAAD